MPKKPIRFLIALSLAALFAGLVYLFAWSSIFTVNAIRVIGAPTKEARQLIETTSTLKVGEKLARVEPRSTAQRVESIEWVQSALISRDWISGEVSITVSSRIPTAQFKGEMIDSSGSIFTLPGFDPIALPKVAASTPALGVQAIELFKSLPEDFSAKVTLLRAVSESNHIIYLVDQGRDIRVQWGKNEETALKVEVFTALKALDENAKIRQVDLSAPHAPIVK